MRKHLLYNFRTLILASTIDQTILFFQSRFLDLFFLICFQIFFKNGKCGDPFKIRWAPKWQPKLTKWRQKVENVRYGYAKNAVLFQTLLSRNHSNPCAVGISWLLKRHFFDVDWLMFCFRCFSSCFVLYNILNNCFKKYQ